MNDQIGLDQFLIHFFNKTNCFQLHTLTNIWIVLSILAFQVAFLICSFSQSHIFVLESIMSYLIHLYPS